MGRICNGEMNPFWFFSSLNIFFSITFWELFNCFSYISLRRRRGGSEQGVCIFSWKAKNGFSDGL